jgi:hypothetical protein
MEHEDHKDVLGSLFERAENYAGTRIDLAKMKAVKKSSEIVSSVASQVVVGIILVFFLMLLNIGLALWVGELLGKTYLGFFAMAGLYLIVGIIVYAGRENMIKVKVANSIIKTIHT